jgi:phage shock protein PspC (stress-responsive transcriptional regulator)
MQPILASKCLLFTSDATSLSMAKTGLLEALCDDLAEAGQISELFQVFTNPDPDEAISGFVACFGRFWDADRTVMRRLRVLGALDPEIGAVIAARDQRRRDALSVLVGRTTPNTEASAADLGRIVRVLHVLTGFETSDALVPAGEQLASAVPEITSLAQQVLRSLSVPKKSPGPKTLPHR